MKTDYEEEKKKILFKRLVYFYLLLTKTITRDYYSGCCDIGFLMLVFGGKGSHGFLSFFASSFYSTWVLHSDMDRSLNLFRYASVYYLIHDFYLFPIINNLLIDVLSKNTNLYGSLASLCRRRQRFVEIQGIRRLFRILEYFLHEF